MHEPTYLCPRHLLFAVQAHADQVATLRRHLADATRDEMPAEHIEHRKAQLRIAAMDFHGAILLAAAEGATSNELIGYGVSRDLAAEVDRRARR